MLGIRTAVLVGVLGLGIAGGSAMTSYAASANPSPIAMDDHPEIHAALDSLRSAREALVSAAHDYHGHRIAAIGHVDAAIAECQECLGY
ncbi:MAG: hypothetical protein ABSF29_01235 [Tepidisphaeraceae bacterium]